MLRLPPCERGTCFVRVLAGSPAYKCFCQRRKPWRKAGFIPAAQVKLIGVPGQSAGLAGGNPKGGGRPPLCRRGGGVHRGGTPSKGSLPCACFWLLFARAKSDPGLGRGGPGDCEQNRSDSGEKCCVPTRPAIRESQPIGAMRQHRRIKKRGTGAKPPKTRRRRGCCLSFSISHFPAWVSQYRQR